MRKTTNSKKINSNIKLLGLVSIILIFAAQAFAAIDVNKSFSPNTVYPGQTSRLTITLLNSALDTAENTAFIDNFPEDVFISPTPNVTSTCGLGK